MVERWTWVALCLVVVGMVMVIPSTLELRPEVMEQGELDAQRTRLELGPFHAEGSRFSMWVEARYPGLEVVDRVDVHATQDVHPEPTYMDAPDEVVVRDIEGVRCQLVHAWPGLRGGGWTFVVEIFEDPPGEGPMQVFLLRSGGDVVVLVLGAGVVVTAVGAASVALLTRGKRGERGRDPLQ